MSDGLQLDYDISEIVHFANQLDRSAVIAQQEIEIFMTKALIVLEKQIVDRTPVNTGTLRGSITKERWKSFSGIRGEVFTPMIYGMPVEYGRKAGKMPPIGPLAYWLFRKGYVTDRKEIRGAAWGLAMHIKEFGTEGAFMFTEGFDAAKPYIERIFGELPDRILKRMAAM